MDACFYFQMHQPPRLRRYSVFENDGEYFDDALNASLLRRVVDKCYQPATRLVLDLVRRHEGRFRVSFSVTGVLVDQLRRRAPAVVDALIELAETDCVELLGETYHHSLAFIHSRDEFREQVARHSAMMRELFGRTPRVFRNTELVYNNDLGAQLVAVGGWAGVLSEGVDRLLDGRSPNHVYHPPNHPNLALLLRDYRLSDDITFRFSDRNWPGWPLTGEKFAAALGRAEGAGGELCNVFIDFETFGEHQWAPTGIFDFLEALPGAVLAAGHRFRTVSEAIAAHPPVGVFDAPQMISWADTERDLSAWLSNAMQTHAMHELYKLEGPVKATGDARLLEDWRRLSVSDHAYYMCTKYFADAAVHDYFNPYESPYDSYINFMNVLDNLRTRVGFGGVRE